MGGLGVQELLRRIRRLAPFRAIDTRHDVFVGLHLAVPRIGHVLQPSHRQIPMATAACVLDAEFRVERGSWNGDRVVRARVSESVPHLLLLQVRHVTRHALAAGRIG